MNQEKKRIIVVDDDVSILRIFRNILEKAGYNVETVETGKDAIEKLQNQKCNVCLVDVKLADINGPELLLKMADTPEIINIIFTGFSSEEVGRKAADYGADDFLIKPVKAAELSYSARKNSSSRKSI